MFEIRSSKEPAEKRRAEMSWIWPAPYGLYIVFITKSEDDSFTVKFPKSQDSANAENLGSISLPSLEQAERLSLALVNILKTAWSDSGVLVTHYDLRGTSEY